MELSQQEELYVFSCGESHGRNNASCNTRHTNNGIICFRGVSSWERPLRAI
jgi:hypothetical protein